MAEEKLAAPVGSTSAGRNDSSSGHSQESTLASRNSDGVSPSHEKQSQQEQSCPSAHTSKSEKPSFNSPQEERDWKSKNKGNDSNYTAWKDNDPENPQNWSLGKKIWCTTVICITTFQVTLGSSAPTVASQEISAKFGISTAAFGLVTMLFLVGFALGPLVFAPLSEMFGRRPVFWATALAYFLLQLMGSLATNFGTLLAGRFLQGLAASSPLTNGGGLIVDIWPTHLRGTAMAFYSGSIFLGPIIGPIMASFVTEKRGYVDVFWVLFAFAGAVTLLLFFGLPETFAMILLQKRAKKRRANGEPEAWCDLENADWSVKSVLRKNLLKPFEILGLEPILQVITVYTSFVYWLIYSSFEVYPVVFQEKRGFNLGEGGLSFIGIGIGTTIGAAISIYLQRDYLFLTKKWHGTPPPEYRLRGSMLAAPILPIALFWLGWTGQFSSISWVAPEIATIPLGATYSLIFISLLSYIVDTYGPFAASGLAANTFARSLFAGPCPVYVPRMLTALGVSGALSLLGGLAIVLAPAPFIFYKYGQTIRKRSRFAPCADLKIRDQVLEEERKDKEGGKEAA
ncbi:uncharacterized protein L969DRAFT_94024 [Mixia osmundae IAM 14324]|uniref:Major facilitator superfamily (MFS) profile domain-containing protein n=1 Tax=Mixia osmundae (strain CBS 9802 / IAM 14324 / JCM 22182 / KY 12970) TaxID=764103 RepID=G7E8V1_MIXOS|nr:uncharacterized protein L969DRAFT_94024 [Mixia osmundae IAM 14324]KEI40205.1 hypothetical protein L969DRAFT_94024 [Mixia osmundae IAM 14324]GAA99569.1 hypothetical protein E5Q_06270 [Mixia osmundae IAM 14324]